MKDKLRSISIKISESDYQEIERMLNELGSPLSVQQMATNAFELHVNVLVVEYYSRLLGERMKKEIRTRGNPQSNPINNRT